MPSAPVATTHDRSRRFAVAEDQYRDDKCPARSSRPGLLPWLSFRPKVRHPETLTMLTSNLRWDADQSFSASLTKAASSGTAEVFV
jgi:hypothetical protein